MGLRVGIDTVHFSEFGSFMVLFSSKLRGSSRVRDPVRVSLFIVIPFHYVVANHGAPAGGGAEKWWHMPGIYVLVLVDALSSHLSRFSLAVYNILRFTLHGAW